MRMAGIELRHVLDGLQAAAGHYVSNVHGVDGESVLVKLHHPDRPDVMLMVSTAGVWPSAVRVRQLGENRLLRQLRRGLARARFAGASQPGAERVAYLRFSGRGGDRVLVGEFFGAGNIVLCGEGMRIEALLRSLDARDRRLRPGLRYEPPGGAAVDALSAAAGSLSGMLSSELTAGKWVGRSLGLPSRYVRHMMARAGVEQSARCADLSPADVSRVEGAVAETVRAVVSGPHEPRIVRGDGGAEAHPLRLEGAGPGEPAGSFVAALDELMTEEITAGAGGPPPEVARRLGEMRSALARREEASAEVRGRSAELAALARSLMGAASAGAQSLAHPAAAAALEGAGARLVREKGAPVLSAAGASVAVDPEGPAQSAASALFTESKRQEAAAAQVDTLAAKARRAIARLEAEAEAATAAAPPPASRVRRKAWYERYRWFYTSGGALAVGGRDSSSNAALIRRRLEPGDSVFHADAPGSPFFLLKGVAEPGPSEAQEVAQATVCFSRAWREAVQGAGAFWVRPEQVRLAAPSGQYLPRGSFPVEGRRNSMRVPSLRMAVGLSDGGDGPVLSCGPPEAVRGRCLMYAVIEPSGLDAPAAAKRLRAGFAELDEEQARALTLDEYVRALPPGTTRVSAARRGEARGA